jgi:ferredoxin-NADP reductase
MTHLQLKVANSRAETSEIRRIVLAHADGGALPPFSAGAHVTLTLPSVGARKYSLINADPATAHAPAPRYYVVGVRLEPNGGGGSRAMHQLNVEDTIAAEPPQNNFSLKRGSFPIALIAGGIGVTPLISMAATLKADSRPFSMVYASRSKSDLAFQSELNALTNNQLIVHTDDSAGKNFDVEACFAALPADAQVYMCGPKPMLKAGMAAARKLGWPRDRLVFELFYSVAALGAETAQPAPEPSDGSFEVVLKNTGQTFRVPAHKTILDVLIEAGKDPVFDCKRGECGVCQVGVLEGIPDHKDAILSDSERSSNRVIQICISRSKSPRLVLDL